MTGMSANSAGCATAKPAPSSAASANVAAVESSTSASTAATSACASDAQSSSRRVSTRSARSPAAGASSTIGPHRQIISAATAAPDPVCSCTCSVSGIQSRKSPRAETPTAPTISLRSGHAARASGAGGTLPPARNRLSGSHSAFTCARRS